MKKITILLITSTFLIIQSCGSSEEKKEEKKQKEKDSSQTDEADMPVVEDVEMEYMYEVTNNKTKKVQMMTQEEYLESGIWENPDVVIREVPVVD